MTVFRLAQQNGLMITDHLTKWKKNIQKCMKTL